MTRELFQFPSGNRAENWPWGWKPLFRAVVLENAVISAFLTKIKKCTSFRCRFTRDGGRICCEMTGQSACMAPFSLMWLQEPLVIAIGRSFDRAFLQAAAGLRSGFAAFGLISLADV